LQQGKSFFFEEGLDPVIAAALANNSLIPTDSYQESVPKSDIVFSCVGTPDNPDGSSDLRYVFSAAETSTPLLKEGALYVQKSTVPVGTGLAIEALFKREGKIVRYVSNPEFLREGTALYDTLYFDRVVAGGKDPEAVQSVLDIYRELAKHRFDIAQLASVPTGRQDGQYISTNLNSAELIKVTSNAFLALKISFANSIAKLADQVQADVVEVMDAVGADPRIGRAFLDAGRGYGGGCFPKDVSGLITSGLHHGVDLEIMTAAQQVNNSMAGYVIEKARDGLGGSLKDKNIAVLGLAFKQGTSDVRRSPGVQIANMLGHAEANVTTYDPQANGEAEQDLRKGISIAHTLQDAIRDADAVIIATSWPELVTHTPEQYKESMRGLVFVDAVNSFDVRNVTSSGLIYIGIGR
jgi:UDPglucose 6-dehydrogenase